MLIRGMVFALMAIPAMFCSTCAFARDLLVLEPSSAWQMDYGEDNCTLVRSFGEDDDATIFAITMFAPQDVPTLRIMSKKRTRDVDSFFVQFSPDTGTQEISNPLRATFGDDLYGVIFRYTFLPDSELKLGNQIGEDEELITWNRDQQFAREREIDGFRIERIFPDDLHLELGSMNRPMDAMRECLDELIEHWGLDAEVQRNLSKLPTPIENPGDWIRPGDYPRGLLQRGYQGIVDFRLIVGPDGEPTDCVIQLATNPDEFAEVSCRQLMRRARFEPARDAFGNAVTSYYRNTVRFVIRN